MARVLSPWCKQAKIRLIELDMTVAELASKVDSQGSTHRL